MPAKSTRTPELTSQSEEAEWYATPEGRRQTEREFVRALRGKTLTKSVRLKVPKSDPSVLQQLMARARATTAISIRIPIADLERARFVAERTGVGYQTVLKQAIREGLKKAG